MMVEMDDLCVGVQSLIICFNVDSQKEMVVNAAFMT